MARWLKALVYTWQGFSTAYRSERAFREECWALLLLLPVAIWLADSWGQFAWLIGSILLVMLVEILNSALEALCDNFWSQYHPTAKRVKDYGSAAVFLSLILAILAWSVVIAPLIMNAWQ